ncbi:MAG: hypothetical protein JZD40_05325 [Sulfolobus sp.]|nr:hypothetical protein [Sulfolobus sp.]
MGSRPRRALAQNSESLIQPLTEDEPKGSESGGNRIDVSKDRLTIYWGYQGLPNEEKGFQELLNRGLHDALTYLEYIAGVYGIIIDLLTTSLAVKGLEGIFPTSISSRHCA